MMKRRKNRATINPEIACNLDIPLVIHSQNPYKMQYANPPIKNVLAERLCITWVEVYGKKPVKKVPIDDIKLGINAR